MSQTDLYNVKAHHHDIPEIYELCQAGVPEDELETLEMQTKVARFWSEARHPTLGLSPDNWLFSKDGKSDVVSKLSAMVDFAFTQVPMYREIYGNAGYEAGSIRSLDDFKKLPILTRADLNCWADDDRLSSGNKVSETYFVGTSGSSGQSLKVFYDQKAAITETYESLVQFSSYVGGRLSPDAWIYNIHMSRGWLSSLKGKYRTFTISEPASIKAMTDHLSKIRPAIMCALPSHLSELAPIGDMSKFGIRAISTNSEQSSRLERKNFESIFGVPVLDEYSSVELGVIAYEGFCGSYHVNEDGLHIEIVDPDEGGFGRVVATDFRSWVMPLIRYDQGDLAAWSNNIDICKCGRPGKRFRDLRGRADDYFLAMDGKKIPSATLLNLVDTLFTSPESPLREFRLQQVAPDRAQLDYVLRDGEIVMPMTMQSSLEQKLVNLMGEGSRVEFMCREALDSTPSYKRKKSCVNSDHKSDPR
ncbi:phenylacetate--CoA ligase family protein [Halomonas sp. BC04]|uniref:phenylacetate--CoA ligase family protein n=1 Tax=Halomonas sp. BC04 TaxID=1403540 RepID=UPI0003ED6DB7|nr:phenylacetate--CoA ligase family protein [Halomonas sp. BC04]EWH00419.1 hypothetical protein Q427_19640 [Halomonas sp. BC04]